MTKDDQISSLSQEHFIKLIYILRNKQNSCLCAREPVCLPAHTHCPGSLKPTRHMDHKKKARGQQLVTAQTLLRVNY